MWRPRRESARARGWCCCLLTGAGRLIEAKGEDNPVNIHLWTLGKSEVIFVVVAVVVVVVRLARWLQGVAEADRMATNKSTSANGKRERLGDA